MKSFIYNDYNYKTNVKHNMNSISYCEWNNVWTIVS